ncbi:MAG: hypothetical protein AB7P99_17970 [Vicinamibacterales bacterium]
MRRILAWSAAVLASTVLVTAQHAVTQAPEAYRTQFENEWVHLVRVHYGPNAHIGVHAHPQLTTAYVYLNRSGPVRFEHTGAGHRVATRQPTIPGAFRIVGGGGESHEVVNTTATPSDFLRVEFKTRLGGGRAPFFRGRRGDYPTDRNTTDVQFTNSQMRVTRLILAPGGSIDLTTPEAQPALLLALSDATLGVSRASSTDLELAVGQEHWIAPRQREQMTNTGPDPAELLRIDFLTPPQGG